MLGAGRGDLLQILGVSVAFFFLFGYGNGYVATILNFMAEGFEARFKSCDAHSRWSHIDAATRLAEIEGNPDDADFPGNDAGGDGSSSHSFNRRGLSNSYGYSRYSLRG